MSSYLKCESLEEKMADADLIRAVYPRHSMKQLARLMGVPLDTSRHWLHRHFPIKRRVELALSLRNELDRQDALRATIRRQLSEIIENVGTNTEEARARMRVRARLARSQAYADAARKLSDWAEGEK